MIIIDRSKICFLVVLQYESGGTCLNMNWEEVSKGQVSCDPPDVSAALILSHELLLILSLLGYGMEKIRFMSNIELAEWLYGFEFVLNRIFSFYVIIQKQ